jgi:hypothetical protein
MSLGDLSSPLKAFVASKAVREIFIDKTEAYVFVDVIKNIANSGNAFLVTIDPFDDYTVASIEFGDVVRLLCGMMKIAKDVRIFGQSWAVSISSYNSNNIADNEEVISLDDLEMKISLIGSATAWPIGPDLKNMAGV